MMYEWPGVMSQIVACFDNLTDNSICQHNESTYGSSQTIALGDLDPNTGGYVSYMYDHCYRGIARIHLVMEVRICRKQTRVLLWRNAKR